MFGLDLRRVVHWAFTAVAFFAIHFAVAGVFSGRLPPVLYVPDEARFLLPSSFININVNPSKPLTEEQSPGYWIPGRILFHAKSFMQDRHLKKEAKKRQAEEERRGKWGLKAWVPMKYRGWINIVLHVIVSSMCFLPWRRLGSQRRTNNVVVSDHRLPKGIMRERGWNTCFVNGFLQVMFHAPGVKQTVMEAASAAERAGRTGQRTLLALAQVFRDLDGGTTSPASASPLLEAMGIDPLVQQDAHEFGRFLFMALGSKYINKIFEGWLVNVIECTKLPFSRENREPFYDLALEVRGSKNLQTALSRFTKPEHLMELWDTGEKGLQSATKRVRLVSFPPVLQTESFLCTMNSGADENQQFQLKRFESGLANPRKIHDFFRFPKALDLPPCPPGGHPQAYRLSAIMMHVGTAVGGHFYSYVRQIHRGNGGVRWIQLDDQWVRHVSEEEVLKYAFGGIGGRRNSSAYVLQYVKEELTVDGTR